MKTLEVLLHKVNTLGADSQFGLQETITLSDGQQITIDGKNNPTVDIRAGVNPESIGTPFFEGSGNNFFYEPLNFSNYPTSADILIGAIYTKLVDGTGGQVFLSNQYQPNTALPSPNGISVGEIGTSDKNGGGYLVIDARSGINLTGQVNVSALDLSDSDVPSYLGNGGNVTLLSQANIFGNSSIFAQGLLGGNVSLISTGDVFLDNGLNINVLGGGGGNITINATNVSLLNASQLRAGIATGLGTPEVQAGDITINASETIAIADSSLISNDLLNTGIGNAGNIEITTNSLVLNDGGQISTKTFGRGNAGRVKITASDLIYLSGVDNRGFGSFISSRVESEAEGNAEGIEIITGSLYLNDGAQVDASTFGRGNTEIVKITASDTISAVSESSQGFVSGISSIVSSTAEGNSGEIEITTSSLSLTNGAQVNTSTYGRGNAGAIKITARETISAVGKSKQISISGIGSIVSSTAKGNAGDIEIITGYLSLTDGAVVSASTAAEGNAAAIKITARDTISLSGVDRDGIGSGIGSIVSSTAKGNAGKIEISTGSLSLTDGATVNGSTSGIGNAGGIEITTGSLSLTDGATVNASTYSKGDAGAIKITASETISAVGSSSKGFVSGIFSQVTETAQGNAGGIEITTGFLSLNDGATVNASTLGRGNAGAVKITARDTITAVGENSQGIVSGIFSQVTETGEDDAGGIEIITGSLSLTDGAVVNASTSGIGNAGAVKITARDTITAVGENSQGIVSGIFSQIAKSTAEGNAGGIEITTGSLSLTDGAVVNASTLGKGNAGGIEIVTNSLFLNAGAQVNASTFGKGDAGAVKITANNTISAVGENSEGLPSAIVSIVDETSQGNSGSIEITTGSLSLTDGAVVNASTFGKGDAGAIKITANDTISAVGENSLGFSSGIFSGVANTGEGNSGGIEITTGSLSLTDGAVVNASTFGRGNTGDILVQVNDAISLTNKSSILSSVGVGGKGIGGNINIQARSLSLTDGSQVSTSLFRTQDNLPGGQGGAGNIEVNVTDFVNLFGVSPEGFSSGLFASSEKGASGAGGMITLTTNALHLADGAVINTLSANEGEAGDITINANTFEATVGGQVLTITRSTGNAGTITLNIIDNLFLSGSDPTFSARFARFGEDIVNNQGAESGLFAQTSGQGIAGNIIINTPIFNLAERAIVSARTSSIGKGGSITINSPISTTLGENSQLNVETSSAGQAGNINITSDTVTIGKNAQISATATNTATNAFGGGSININASNLNIAGQLGIFAETQGQVPAGTLTLNPDDSKPILNIRFIDQGKISASTLASGIGGDINISAPNTIALRGNGTIATSTSGSGNAGNIHFDAPQLTLAEGVEITASTTGIGNAGTITLTGDRLTSTNRSSIQTNTASSGKAGNIVFQLQDNLTLTNSTVEASTDLNSTGDGGNISIDPKTVILTDGARISVNSQGQGDGGNISLFAQNLTLNNGSSISATTASGEGGNITLNVPKTISQRNNSPITATAGGTGNGGNITIKTQFLIGNDNSDITANAFEGAGGNINITADGIFRNPNSEITASSQLGIDGVIETDTPEVDPSRGLINLPQNLVDPNALISQNACRKGGQSEFTVRGRGGLPSTPEQVQSSNEVEVGLVGATEVEATTKPVSSTSMTTRKIIPAQGWRRNAKGEMVLVAYPTADGANRQVATPTTCSSNQESEAK